MERDVDQSIEGCAQRPWDGTSRLKKKRRCKLAYMFNWASYCATGVANVENMIGAYKAMETREM